MSHSASWVEHEGDVRRVWIDSRHEFDVPRLLRLSGCGAHIYRPQTTLTWLCSEGRLGPTLNMEAISQLEPKFFGPALLIQRCAPREGIECCYDHDGGTSQ